MSSIRSSVRNFFSGEVSVAENSWHYRIYSWWVNHDGGNTWGYKENFCHYCRVVLIWAPWRWVVYDLFKSSPVRLLTAIFWIAYVCVFLIFSLTKSVEAALLSFVALLITTALLRMAYLRDPVKFENRVKQALKWYFTAHRFKVVYPWSVTLVVLFVVASLIFGPVNVLLVIAAGVGLVLGLALAIIALAAIFYLLKRIVWDPLAWAMGKVRDWWYAHWTAPREQKRWEKEREELFFPPPPITRPKPAPKKKGSSVLQLIWAFILAKKRKICPFIKLPEREQNLPWWQNSPIRDGGMEN